MPRRRRWRPGWQRSAKASTRSATSKGATSRSTGARRSGCPTGCGRWRPIWSAAASPRSSPQATSRPPRPATETSTIPIVFLSGSGSGPQQALPALPIGRAANVTGLSWYGVDLAPARLALVHQLAPQATVIGLLLDPDFADSGAAGGGASRRRTRTVSRSWCCVPATASEIEAAFATLVGAARRQPWWWGKSTFFVARREQLIELAVRHRCSGDLSGPGDGGGRRPRQPRLQPVTDAFRRAGVYTGWIIKGAAPADLPILQSSKVELVINLATAKALGLELPPNLPRRRRRADPIARAARSRSRVRVDAERAALK